MKHRLVLYLVIGVLLLWLVAYATISANYPKLYSPYSLVIVIPLLSLYDLFGGYRVAFVVATFAVPVLFAVWSLPLVDGQQRIPRRTKIAAVALVLLSAFFLVQGWAYGLQYQGAVHTIAMYVFNATLWLALAVIGRKNSKSASYSSNFLFHWILFAWLGWVAFPWLGELM